MAKKKRFESTRLSLFPTCAVVATSIDDSGTVGGCTIAWNGILSSRPMVVGLSFLPDSFTRKCILQTRDFVVNVPDGRYVKEVNYLGSLSGSWKYKMDNAPKDNFSSLTLQSSTLVRSPYIEEFYLNFECRLLQVVQLGLYDCLLGEVLTMHCDEEAFLNTHRKGNVDHQNRQPILCLGDEYWTAGQLLGHSNENKDHPHGQEH